MSLRRNENCHCLVVLGEEERGAVGLGREKIVVEQSRESERGEDR